LVSFTLTYFPVRGCAEVIRVMLKVQGAEFDKNINFDCTGPLIMFDFHSQFFGQLPKFEHCGLTLYQINVVRRHLARKLGRWRNNIKACLQHNEIPIESPIMCNMSCSISDSGKEGYLKTLPTDLMPFEKTLSRNKGSFLVDNKIHVFLGCFGLGLLMFSCEDFKNGPIIPGKRA
uniref:glutathione transferase n=1 Tax=Salmo trutta TaxID=8032 RepID=A0A673ZWK9_SALTR